MGSQQWDKVTIIIFLENQCFHNVSEFGFANAGALWKTHLGMGEKNRCYSSVTCVRRFALSNLGGRSWVCSPVSFKSTVVDVPLYPGLSGAANRIPSERV